MSIMDMFRSAKPTQPMEPAERASAANLESGQPTGQPQAPNQPHPEAAAPQAAPLDKFKDLWAAPKEGEAVAPSFDPTKMFKIDPAEIQKEVSKINFAGSVTPEQVAAITAGGEGAQQAFMAAMNAVAQQTFAQSMLTSAKLVEGAMTQANNSMDARIDQRAKQFQASNSLREANPALSHPAAAPFVTAMENQLAQKHPTATPSELTKMAQEMLSDFALVAAGKPKVEETTRKAPDDVDWEAFFGTQS